MARPTETISEHEGKQSRPYYTDYSEYISRFFDTKVQKLSVNTGLGCPNRDGRISFEGCSFCNNTAFTPSYCDPNDSVSLQLEKGKAFFSRKAKHSNTSYLAYFQSYSNTYAPIEKLEKLYNEALSVERIYGLVIGTRPDTVSDDVLRLLSELRKKWYVMVELGVESTNDAALKRINRGHTFECVRQTVSRLKSVGLEVGAHIILGLPGETTEDMLMHADRISELDIDILKLHQLQIVRGTRMEREWNKNPAAFSLFDVDQYIDLVVNFMTRLRNGIAIERFTSESPSDLLIAPKWGLKNHEFKDKLEKCLRSCR